MAYPISDAKRHSFLPQLIPFFFFGSESYANATNAPDNQRNRIAATVTSHRSMQTASAGNNQHQKNRLYKLRIDLIVSDRLDQFAAALKIWTQSTTCSDFLKQIALSLSRDQNLHRLSFWKKKQVLIIRKKFGQQIQRQATNVDDRLHLSSGPYRFLSDHIVFPRPIKTKENRTYLGTAIPPLCIHWLTPGNHSLNFLPS